MSCPVLAKASHAWLFISITEAVSGGDFLPWVASAECVINLSNNEHLLSYPEKLRLCHGAVRSEECPGWCNVLRTNSDSSCWRELPGDGGRTTVGYGGDKRVLCNFGVEGWLFGSFS